MADASLGEQRPYRSRIESAMANWFGMPAKGTKHLTIKDVRITRDEKTLPPPGMWMTASSTFHRRGDREPNRSARPKTLASVPKSY